jgi:hypothetical protein
MTHADVCVWLEIDSSCRLPRSVEVCLPGCFEFASQSMIQLASRSFNQLESSEHGSLRAATLLPAFERRDEERMQHQLPHGDTDEEEEHIQTDLVLPRNRYVEIIRTKEARLQERRVEQRRRTTEADGAPDDELVIGEDARLPWFAEREEDRNDRILKVAAEEITQIHTMRE